MLERKPRLFIGIAVDDAVRNHCAEVAERLGARHPNLRFVEPDNYHLTLAFLGNVEVERVADIERALATVALRHRAFAATLNRVGAFPHERKPRIIFIGSRGVDPHYRALAADVRNACASIGLAVDEKDDISHVTIARAPSRKRVTLPPIDVASIPIVVNELTLFESVAHDGRSRYLVRATAGLRLG